MSAQERIDKLAPMAELLDAYGSLLTQRQQQALSLFYEEDHTLAEIAEQSGSSRQAVHDLIRRGEAQLRWYEDRLHLTSDARRRRLVLEEIERTLTCASLAETERGKLRALLKAI